MKRKSMVTPQKIVGTILFISLALSVVYAFVHFLQAPDTAPEGMPHAKVRSDYLLMLTQCILGLAVMLLPSVINRRWSVPIPRKIYIAYYVFLFCAIFLGEVFDFYYVIPHWDIILHAFSGAMLSALGFIMVDLLNSNQRVSVELSPFFESVFAFCFALSLGAIWEIYEFAGDMILGLNMQKAYLANGTALVGKAALFDTIEQLIHHTSKRARNQRTHHLCNMGGAILALCPEMDALDKMEFYDLMRQVFRLPEVQKLIAQTTKA